MSIWLATYLIGWAATSGYGIGSCTGHEPCPAPLFVVAGAAWPVYAVGGAYYLITE